MSDTTCDWEAFRESANIEEQVMLSDETHEQYENHLRRLYEEFKPVGLMEENQILKIAKTIWIRNRLDRYTQYKMRAKQHDIENTNKISRIEEELKPLAPDFRKATSVREVEELLKKLDSSGKRLIVARWPLEKCKPPGAWGSVIAEGLSALAPAKRFEGQDEFLRMVEVFPIDEDISTLERMDATIDRTLKRFMQLKTMKQMFRQLEPKLIEKVVNV